MQIDNIKANEVIINTMQSSNLKVGTIKARKLIINETPDTTITKQSISRGRLELLIAVATLIATVLPLII